MVSFLIFAVLTTLLSTVYAGIQKEYGVEKEYVDSDGLDVMDRLVNINIISGINESVSGLYKLTSPTGSTFDILGALASVGIGFLKVVTGVITFPIEIVGVITDFYYVPPVVSMVMGLIFIVYIGFIIVNNYTGGRSG